MTFSIRTVARELVEYREGRSSHVFIGAWGVSPPVLYLPRAEDWDRVVPEAFRGRRDEIIDRLRADPFSRGIRFEDAYA